jgi:RNA polymerase sigma factor for flagellar operon FliA
VKEDLEAASKRLLPKIKKMAKRFRAQFPRSEAEDLEQEGMRGLLKAWERYDDTNKAKLETFAHPWIKGAMQMHVRDGAKTHRYEREAKDAVDDVLHKQDIGSGNSLADAVQEIADTYSISGYTRQTPEDKLLEQEAFASAEAFYAELSERDREFVRLRYVEKLPIAEVALALGYQRSTIFRLEERMLEQLRRRHMASGG